MTFDEARADFEGAWKIFFCQSEPQWIFRNGAISGIAARKYAMWEQRRADAVANSELADEMSVR